MTTYVKVMSEEDLSDSDPSKGFKMFTLNGGDSFEFQPNPHSDLRVSLLEITRQQNLHGELIVHRETYNVPGNAYVMNEMGKTIATFTKAPFRPQPK